MPALRLTIFTASLLALFQSLVAAPTAATFASGTVVTEHLLSNALRETKTGLDPNRTVKIYLPPSYATTPRAFPVVYYFHSLGGSAEKFFAEGKINQLLDRNLAQGRVREFILVVADYTTPTLGCWFENSSTTGRWLDFTTDELLPFIDGKFRTLRGRENRAAVGDFLGGYAALKFAMLYPDLFSVVYAMHPVGTGTGLFPGHTQPIWKNIFAARTFADLDATGFARPFVAMAQAYLPNPNRPPFYCDFMTELENGVPVANAANTQRWMSGFLLDQMLPAKGANLRRMRGLAFDWARYDPNFGHVYSNQAFTRKLDELGVVHEAEEYLGDPWSRNFTESGRFATRALPFLERYLDFGPLD